MNGTSDDRAGYRSSMRWLGHATTLISDRGTSVLTDPVLTARVAHLRRRRGPIPDDADVAAADVVLLSHLHADHTHLPSLRMLDADVPIVLPRHAPDAMPALRELGARLIEVGPGDEVPIGEVVIRAVPAEHDGRRWRHGPHVTSALGYVVVGDSTTYFAGDTDLYPDLGKWVREPDLALLPVGGWGPTLGAGHLNPVRAVAAAEMIGARRAVPIHYGTLWPIGLDRMRPELFHDPGAAFVREAAEHGVAATELAPGDRLVTSDE
ncbi:MBL fold metallo-hydrolase [Gordonia sp. SL306]|uniref:MBL fold metallo-hydrolase n=1 Tax=Gordonia sp. SL306 TaxID=2995145 RepID=UPI0022707597|nr:MBL fold metallo-hydrolase [Gordonia sp. SL306]WAC57109.1 MBL fold metallo-hydrolase [Gordonia sp. SL306]